MTETGTAMGPGPLTTLAGPAGFFEDFPVDRRIRHSRSATVTDVENNQLSKQLMNTAQAHWNEEFLPAGRVVFGLVTASMVLGLASQDTASQALAELTLDELRFLAPVRQGATLTAYSEVVASVPDDDHPDAGRVTFRHHGTDATGTVVFHCLRTVLLKRRSHWLRR